MRKQKGFSLIELLIVVAIILIIAAIAVPNLMRSRMSANEASAVMSIRSINSAEAMYQKDNGKYADLGTLGTATLIDSTLAAAVDATHAKSGYAFLVSNADAAGFVVGAAPIAASSGTPRSCQGLFGHNSKCL